MVGVVMGEWVRPAARTVLTVEARGRGVRLLRWLDATN